MALHSRRASGGLVFLQSTGDAGAANATEHALYLTCSAGSCTLRELLGWGLQRLALLQELSDSELEPAEAEAQIERMLRSPAYRFLQEYPGKADAWSHFILRLALGSFEFARDWWIQAERQLLRFRLRRRALSLRSIDSLVALAEQVAPPELRAAPRPLLEAVPGEKTPKEVYDTLRGDGYPLIHEQLKNLGHTGTGNLENMGLPMFRVPFELVLQWVRHRQLWLQAGYAWVPALAVNELVLGWYEIFLRRGTATAEQHFAVAPKATRLRERLTPILLYLREQHSAWKRTRIRGTGRLQGIDRPLGTELHLTELDTAIPDMPLCMRLLLERLRQCGHLRHGGRLQLGLFLKEAGFTLSDSLQFWRDALRVNSNGRPIANHEFEREYAYGIRYNYGLEGKRKNCPAFSCARILDMRPGAGEHHGCPFQELAQAALEQAVRTHLRITDPMDIEEITRYAAAGQPQRACAGCLRSGLQHRGNRFEEEQQQQQQQQQQHEAGTAAPSETLTRVYGDSQRLSIASLRLVEHPNEYFAQMRLARHMEPGTPQSTALDGVAH
jgi:DNA primase large subunit